MAVCDRIFFGISRNLPPQEHNILIFRRRNAGKSSQYIIRIRFVLETSRGGERAADEQTCLLYTRYHGIYVRPSIQVMRSPLMAFAAGLKTLSAFCGIEHERASAHKFAERCKRAGNF